MAYFVSSSKHPLTLICVKNQAVSELQWRTRDLLQLAEQSHSLSKMTLWAGQFPIFKKNTELAKATSKQAAESPWIKVAVSANIQINSVEADSDPQAIPHQVSPPREVEPAPLLPATTSPSTYTTPQSASLENSQSLKKSISDASVFSSWSWGGLGAGGLLLAAAASGGGGSKPSTNNTSSSDKQIDINQQSIETTTELQGLVMAGPLKAEHGLTIDVFDANGLKLASSVAIDSSGHFVITLKNMAGKPVLIQVSDNDNSPDYIDEASGQPKDLELNLRAVITMGTQSTQQVSVTPLTELAAQMLLKNQKPQTVAKLDTLTSSDITTYSLAVSKALGIDEQIPVTELQPVNLLDTTVNNSSNPSSPVKYAKALAILSSMEKAGSTDLQAVINLLQQGMLEGLNGKLSEAVLKQLLIDVHHQGRIITRSEIHNQLDPNNSIIPVENSSYRLTSDWIPDQTSSGTNGIVIGNLQKSNLDNGTDITAWTVDDSTNFKVVGQKLIFIGQAANFQQKRYYGITLNAEDGSYSQSFTVKVNSAPTGISLSQNLINENISTNAVIGDFTVVDIDGLGNNVLSLSGADSVFFSVNGRQLVRNNDMPGNLSKSSYQFKVISTDGGLVYSSDISLQVNKAPTAINIAGSLTVNDGASLPVNLGAITVHDDGFGVNTLSINGVDKRFFSINNNNLKFNATTQELATQSTFNFILTSTDGSLVFNQNFTLKTNKAPTDITLSSNRINENISVTGSGVRIGTINVTDDGVGTNTLTITGADANSFSLSGNDLMFTGTSPDYETKSLYSINIKSTDGNLALTRPFYIYITNVNEAPTGISLSSNLIPNGANVASGGISLGMITVSDDGLGTNTLILVTDGDAGMFAISGTTLVYKGSTPNFSSKPVYNISIKATDSANSSLTFTQSITVKVNQAPTAIRPTWTLTSLPENTVIGSGIELASLTTTDDGLGNNTLSVSDATNFSILNNKLYFIGASPNYETKPTYTFTITSTDGSLTYTTDDLTFNISNVNEAPTGIYLTSNLLPQNSNVDGGLTVGTLGVNDDSVGTYTFSLLGGDDASLFTINGSSLKYTGANNRGSANKSSYSLSIKVTDTSTTPNLTYSQSVTVQFNKAPTAITPNWTVNPLPENTVIGTGYELATLTVTDDGLGINTLSVSDTTKFSIVNNKLLFIGASPDYETKQTYTFTITSTDGELTYTTDVLTFNISNVNEAPTGISLSSNLLPNGAAVDTGLTVGTLQVQDDALGTNTLSLAAEGDAALFAISGTSLIYKGSTPNASSKASYNLTIKATDSANTALTYSQAVTVQVNKAPTAITPNWTVNPLPENTVIGSGYELATLNITDDGLGTNTLSVSDNTNFRIVNNKLYFIGNSPDFETKSSYTFTLKSTDGSLTYTTSTLTLNISNVNEAPRSITLSGNSFNENTSAFAGLTIATLNVTDDASFEDTNTYSVEGADAQYFRVDKIKNTSGTGYTKKLIYTGMPVNYESGRTGFDITIKSTDGALVYSQNFRINVNDVNEAPASIYLSNLQKLQDKAPTGTRILIGNLNVVDDAQSTVTYSLDSTKTPDSSLFTIISNQLYYNSSTPPDYKSKPRYIISVKATDGGLSRQQQIAVDVSAVNLAPTALSLSNNQIFQGMPTNNRGMLVGYITVTDNDGVSENTLSLDGTDQNNFTIYGNALYFTGSSLNYSSKQTYSINIVSTDGSLIFNQPITVNVLAPVSVPLGPDLHVIEMSQATTKTFSLADFGLTQASNGGTVTQIIIKSLPISGTLKFNNTVVISGASIPADQLGQLTYTPPSNTAMGFGQASFNYSLSGNGIPLPSKSLVFDGVDDYVNLGSISAVRAITLEAWVKPYSSNNPNARIFDLGNGQGSDNIVLTLNTFTGYLGNVQVANPINIPSKFLISNSWIHLAATLENNFANVYVNGELVSANGFSTTIASGSNGSFSAPNLNLLRTSNFIGRSNWSPDPYFKGEIADARIYNTARSLSQIQRDMSGYFDSSDTTILRREVAGLDNSTTFKLVNGPLYTDLTHSAVIQIQAGKIGWGDGSGYGNYKPDFNPDGGGDNDSMSGTLFSDVLFGDGSGGASLGMVPNGLAGAGNDFLSGLAGNDILFGDGFEGRGSDGGYGGGGGGKVVWENAAQGKGGVGAGNGQTGYIFAATNSWLGPLNLSVNNQLLLQGKAVDNWGAGAGVRNGTTGNINDQVWDDLSSAKAIEAYGSRGVYAKVLWDLSQGTTGFGSGISVEEEASGFGSKNIDSRVYKQITGKGNDVLRGGTGNDWLMGGGGADAFVWGGSDLDGGKDYVVDFDILENDEIRIESGVLTNYLPSADLSRWFKLQTGLRNGSPFEAGNGVYSLLQIDKTGTGNFTLPSQSIYFRSDALSHAVLNDFIQISDTTNLEQTVQNPFNVKLTDLNWQIDRGVPNSMDAKDVLRLRFNQAVELDATQLSSTVFGSGFVVRPVNPIDQQSKVWEITLGSSPSLSANFSLTLNGVFDAKNTTDTVTKLLSSSDVSAPTVLRFNADELYKGITFDGWVAPNTALTIQWGSVKDSVLSDAAGYWSYSFYSIESYFGRKAPASQQDHTISLRNASDSSLLWQQTARIDDTAIELKSLTGPALTTSITPGQAISLSLGLTQDMGTLLKPEQFQSFGGSLNITAGSGNQQNAVFTASQITLPTLAHVHLNAGDLNDAAFNTNALTKGLDIQVKVGGIAPLRPLSRELQLRQGQQIRLDLRDPVTNTNTTDWQIEVRGLAIGQTLNKGTWSNGTYTLAPTDLADLQLSAAANSLVGTTPLTLTYLKNRTPFSQANLSLQVLPWLMPSSHSFIFDYRNVSQVWETWNTGLTGLSGRGVEVEAEDIYFRPELNDFAKGRVLKGSTIGVNQIHGYETALKFSGGWNSETTGVSYETSIGWGSYPDVDVQNISKGSLTPYLLSFHPIMAIDSLRLGRNGLGKIVVYSSGNDGNTSNVSVTEMHNYPGYLTIASVSRDTGEVTDFSTIGESLSAVATGDGGTSFAAPFVSGTVALMLQANPGLGFRDVQDIVAYSSSYLATTTPIAGFNLNAARTLNGAGLHFSHLAGFGLINAYNATRLATDWFKAGYDPATAANWTQKLSEDTTTTFSFNNRNLSTSANTDVSAFLTFNKAISLGEVALSVNINDPNYSTLDITLIAPDRSSYNFSRPTAANGIFTSSINVLGNNNLSKIFTQGTWQLDFSHAGSTTPGATVTDIQLSFKDINQNLMGTIKDASFKSYSLPTPAGVETQTSLTVTEDMDVQAVVIEGFFDDNRFDLLQLDLTSPAGTVSHILTGDTWMGGTSDSHLVRRMEFQMPTHRFWGESSKGTWTLSFSHAAPSGPNLTVPLNATVKDIKLLFLGDEKSADQRYVYTNEMRTTYTDVADAATKKQMLWLDDRDNGNDSFMGSALGTDVKLDLGPHGWFSLDRFQVRMTPGTRIENAFGGDGNDVLQGLHDGKSMLNGNAGNDVLMAYGNGSQLDGGIADDWLWLGGNSVGTGGQGGDNFIFFNGQTALPDLVAINARITDFDPVLDHVFSYETNGIFKQAQFDLSGQLLGWAQVNDTSFIQTLTQQQSMSAKPDLLAVSMSGSSLTLSFDQPLVTTGPLSCQLDGLALQSSSLSGKSLTLNYTNTGSGVHQLDFANAPIYSMLGIQPDFTKLYLGTVNGEQIDASAAPASVALFGNGGADTLIGGSSSDLLMAPTATSATLRGGNGADVFRIKNAGMNGNIYIDDFSISQGDRLDLDDLLSGFAADSFIEDCVQLTKNSNDALLKFDLSGDGIFNISNPLSIQLSGIYARQTVAEVTLRSLMYGLQADTVI